MTDVARRDEAASLETVKSRIDLSAWGNALINGTAYEEVDPDYLQRAMMMRLMMATSAEEVFAENAMDGLQKLIPNAPGAYLGPIEIQDLYVTASQESKGTPTYVILGYEDLESGRFTRTTTGAGYLQTQLITLINIGQWPIRCIIKRLEKQDRGGRGLLQLFPPD